VPVRCSASLFRPPDGLHRANERIGVTQ
jgi:hypothetical protein